VGSAAAEAPVEVPLALAAWLAATELALMPPVRWQRMTGGSSNLTYQLTDDEGRRCVLRRSPDRAGHSTHDVLRESRIVEGLGGSGLPVAKVRGTCADSGVIGAPFFVMSFVEGTVLTTVEAAEATTEAYRVAVSESFVDALAVLHRIDPEQVGLAGLARNDGYVERQLRRWIGQYRQSRTQDVPLIEDVYGRLKSRVPRDQHLGIVHGDYRLENVMFDETGQVSAVLDWELATLGETSADLAWALLYWTSDAEEAEELILTRATALPGFLSREDMAARYALVSGRSMDDMNFYLAFASWRASCIAEGVLSRYVHGQMSARGVDLAKHAHAVRARAQLADELLRRVLSAADSARSFARRSAGLALPGRAVLG
jgi:aminoglycoside phosphotransferase (APT) family kinase protein